MSFRNRPVLDRRHRPRWQDELRTQQIVVACFAVAIALALGIFGATVWNSYYQTHLRQVAVVEGTTFDQDALASRTGAIAAELSAKGADLQAQLGGARDQVVNQQLDVINGQLQTLSGDATTSLVDGAFMRDQAASLGISVSDQELDAEIAKRADLPLRLKLSAITINALPADAKADAKPTDAQWAAAEKAAKDLLDQLKGGADFAKLAAEKNGDAATKQTGGLVGWVQAGDAVYGNLFDAAKDANANDFVGPIKTTGGYTVVRVDDRSEAGRNETYDKVLDSDASRQAYRSYVRDELLRKKFQDYFGSNVIKANQPQRKVAEIFIAPDQTGVPVPKLHLRHILIAPIPGEQDQSKATAAQWAAALEKAKQIRAEAAKPDADWYELAKQSNDDQNKNRAGDLGWYDPSSSPFVEEFKQAVARMQPGEVSQPVKTEFGYHIIKVVGRRINAADEAQQLVSELRKDPDSFAEVARDSSEDAATGAKGGEVGWVAHYELPAERDAAVFKLSKENPISDPVVTNTGTYIYKLLDSSDSMPVPDARMQQIKQTGFDAWFAEQKQQVQIWIDPQLQAASGSAPTTG
jgi:parvulin-like peptidyl-prolyl isomerase